MKFSAISYVGLACLLLASCGSHDSTASIGLPSSGISPNSPLDIARVQSRPVSVVDTASDTDGSFLVGDFVETIQPNTPMFATAPKAGSVPQQVLDQGVVLVVLAFNGNYMQVQTEQGETGYVAKFTVVPQGVSQVGEDSDTGQIVMKESEMQEIAEIVSGEGITE